MSAILGIFGAGDPAAVDGTRGDDALRRMLGRMRSRGASQVGLWREGGAALAVTRHDWEFGPGFSGPVLVVQESDCVIAADASLYYRDDLRRKVAGRGVRPTGQTPSHLILAAYRAFGERCPEELEGDFAFVLFDRRSRRVLAARDFAGKRPLYYAELANGTLLVTSTMGGVLAHPECPQTIDFVTVAESMAAYVGAGKRTAYRAVCRLDAAHTLVRNHSGSVRTAPHWEPPVFESPSRVPFEDAAIELRELLANAVAERASQVGATTVWMSGGRDSTAVFAAGEQTLRERGAGETLLPISVSYPPGDPGREDEYIEAVAGHWGRPVRWVNALEVPLLDRPAERAAERDEPFAHLYEMFNRRLARESASLGSHVALDGVGGDQLFLVSSVYLSDLLRRGRLFELVREWRAGGFTGSGFRSFFRWAIQPALPSSMLYAARFARNGRPLQGELRRRLPEWIEPEFAARHGLSEHVRALPRPRRGESIAATESRWYFTDPFFPAVFGMMASFALEEGVELRSPLYDARLLSFAATRPRDERCTGHETKRLLRRAMKGLVPDEVLANRNGRTGVTAGYFDRAMREVQAGVVTETLRQPVLARLGLVEPEALERGRSRFMRTGSGDLGLRLFLTMQAELWMRARTGATTDAGMRDALPIAAMSERHTVATLA
jgi:asparagine synthase (glutamine-hydrolysing)